MEATQVNIQMTPCGSSLPELEVSMINTMVACLGNEHRKLDERILQLALAASRLASDPNEHTANQRAIEVWDEIRRDLWSHLQIEDGLVFSWGRAHHAISSTLLDTLKRERQEMHKWVAALPALASDEDREQRTAADRGAFAQTLMALAQTLNAHVERYDGEVLPSLLHALFHR
jgi:iron-sulfur cluster repair protein YtfE (RIC family)